MMKRIIAPLLIGLIGAAILITLGTWQVQRLAWKSAVLDDIDRVIAGDTQPLPTMISPSEQRYVPVALEGTVEEGTLYVLVSVKRRGPGWRVISPFFTTDGRRVLLDRGFIPTEEKSDPRYIGPARITGNLHWTDDRNSSTPENDVAGNTWFARDIAQMSEQLKTEPILIITRTMSPPDPGLLPLPVDSSGVTNDHLQYAITWFSLAGIWLLMTGVWIRRLLQQRQT
ncbi:SURF1 family protein [Pelagimonas varians]|uniref:SURF1-like protein n=1 Tax=Pelagimonas varians TaxID=696760 RepID=A0A238L3E7_9RHOB|nr:SURF1 family protein [Pelagimonas varians]PYG26464.1 surfeit locus 1 family protein [Pelagimonas varians]SMX49603.1 SURF1 family protein [Pelagimonas varians]